jgi:cytoskeletal protein CcmA (bactofilin family)
MANFGKSIVFKGDLSGEEDLEIEGRVEGQVHLPNHQLTIGAHGRVAAHVQAKLVVVVGHVAGDVIASERVEVQATGVVDGDIHSPRLLIQEGAVVNGKIEMGGGKPKSEAPSEGEAQRKTA